MSGEKEKIDYAKGKLSICQSCPLVNEPGIVFGEGPKNARMFLVGEAPGAEEAYHGRPFIGGSGRLLTVLLSKAGINRSEVYISNAIKCRPPGNRKPTGEEITKCSPILESEIAEVNPNVIVALGDTALSATTYKIGITKFRGIPLPGLGGKKVIGTFHPANLLWSQTSFAYPIFDLQRARGESNSPDLQRVKVEYNRDGTLSQMEDMHAVALQHGYIIYDIETAMTLDPKHGAPICNGFGVIPGRADCYRWTPHLIAKMKEIFADERIEKVGQNSESFDQPYLEYYGCEFKGRTADTMLMFHLINSDLKKDLETINSFYTDIEPWKHEKGGDLFTYNCKDIDVTARAYLGLKTELKSIDLLDMYYNHVAPLQPILRRMSAKGIRKDIEKAVKWSFVMRRNADTLESSLRVGFGDPFLNVNSPQQLMKLLYTDLGLPVQYINDRKRGKRPTANEEALEALTALTDNPIFMQIIEIRELRKASSTFIDVEHDENGFVHPRFGCAKAATGRLNSWDPNAQNYPLELREIYIPDTPEHVFFSADWSQVEWRLAMVLSGDRTGLELLAAFDDQHTAIAAETLGIPYANVTKFERYNSKFIVYGLAYGRGGESISKQLSKTPQWKGRSSIEVGEFVNKFVARFSKKFATFWKWRERNVRFVEQNGYLANAWKRRRYWFSRTVTEVFNFPQQSNAADMMYDALIAIDADMPPDASLRLTVHDEVVGIAAKDVVKQVRDVVTTHMNRTWPQIRDASANPEMIDLFYPQGWSCPADVHLGLTWKESKDGNSVLEKELFG